MAAKFSNLKTVVLFWIAVLLLVGGFFPDFRARAAATDHGSHGVPAGDEHGAVIKEVRIAIDAHPNRQPTYARMADALISLKGGDILTDRSVEKAVEALKQCHRFATIHVDSTAAPGGEVLTFSLTPYRTIKDIRIRGNYPLFEQDILNQMTLYPGDPYTPADLSKQTEAIAERYRREGYIAPRVSVDSRWEEADDEAVIIVEVDKGPHAVLGSLTVTGNRGLSDSALQWHMRVWRTALIPGIGRFSEYRLQKDIDTLVNLYRRKGFADIKINYRLNAPGPDQRVDVHLQIDEGPRYRIDFEGNRYFWSRTLKKEIALFVDGNLNNTGVRKSIRNMRNRYHQEGFLDVRIEARTTDIQGTPVPGRRISFAIREGPQTLVDRVSIVGNRSLPDGMIRKQILTRPPGLMHEGVYDPETLEEDAYAVSTLYRQQGYLQSTVDPVVKFTPDRSRATVAVTIDEGPRATVQSLSFRGLTVLPEAEALALLTHRVGEPLRTAALNEEKESLASRISETGHPHVAVETQVAYSEDRTRADIVYHVDEGPHVLLGNIFISGNLRTKESVIRRELGVRPGNSLSLRDLHDGQRRLRDLAIFHQVRYRTPGLREKEDTVNLFVEVEEEKPYYVQIGGGYKSDSGFFGRTQLGDHNLLGLNKDLWAGAEVSQTGYRVETRLTEPRFLGTRTRASIGAFNEEVAEFNQPFGIRTSGGSLGFDREWEKSLTTALVFSLEKRDVFEVDHPLTATVEEDSRTIFVATPTIRYDTRDSFVRPTHGFYGSLGVDISKGFENRWDDFVRCQGDARLYRTPVKGLTLAAMARGGQIWPYSHEDRVPDDQLFFLGGIGDIRGFKENLLRFDAAGDPVGGKTALAGSLEARIDLGLNWELTTFFDIGSVSDALVEEGSDAFRESVGAGLRYITPIGPMGLLYGHKLDRREGESAGRWHISIGYSF